MRRYRAGHDSLAGALQLMQVHAARPKRCRQPTPCALLDRAAHGDWQGLLRNFASALKRSHGGE